MFCHWVCFLLATLVGLTHGEETVSLKVSQKTFGIIAVKLVTNEYKTLLSESNALQHNITACQTLTSQRNSSCRSCIHSHAFKCAAGSGIFLQIGAIAGPAAMLGAELAANMMVLGQQIANGAPQIYTKYGIGAANGLRNGFNGIGSGFSSMGSALKKGFAKAFNSLKYAFASVANMKNWMTGFVKLFGKRRRSYGSTLSESLESLDSSADYLLAEETPQLLREKRSSIGKCLNDSCPECKAFYNSAKHDSYWVYRRVCGSEFIDSYLAIEKKINQTEQFYMTLKLANVDVLKTVEVGKTTYNVTTLVAYNGAKYVTYHPTNITFDPWTGSDAGYMAIAKFLLNTYK